LRLKLRALEVFHAVMEEGSISTAAKRLNLSQPAVSVALANLEHDLGFALFHRSKGAFTATTEAQLLHEETEQSLLAVGRFASRAKQIRDGGAGSIRVATFGGPAINFLPRIISEFTSKRPKIEIDLQVRSSRQVLPLVGGGQADIGLVEVPTSSPSLEFEMFAFECVCLVRQDSQLAQVDVITPRHLDGHQVIGIMPTHVIDRQVERVFADEGIELVSPIKSYFFAIARNLVRDGVGVAIVDPANGLLDLADGVLGRPFRPVVRYEMSVVRRAKVVFSPVVQEFFDLLKQRLANL
jgi:DNA-binding transcriptional LysR family regulator